MTQDESFETLGSVDPSVIGPRLGRLKFEGRNELNTPNFIALTSRGAVPHMTPDVVAKHTDIRGMHMALEDCEFIPRLRIHFPS
jgi:queuine tRNA-ribosyltransferase subunit QTRTD1